jgi:MFS transporter, FSR family, fosmidomycin resistance protein
MKSSAFNWREVLGPEAKVTWVVSLAHGYSHFSHLLLVPLFVWIKLEFGLSYTEMGLLMTAFFVVSGVAQALAGFVVDRIGAVPVLMGSMALYIVACLGLALAPSYAVLMFFSGLAGLANSPFHPADYSILNARIAPRHLGSAYAVHGIAGNIGWGLAPVFLAGIAAVSSWRWALVGAAVLALAILLVLIWQRAILRAPHTAPAKRREAAGVASSGSAIPGAAAGQFAFLRLPAVWMSFGFFGAYAFALGGVQSFGSQAAADLHTMPLAWVAMLLTVYMIASAVGMIVGGLMVTDPERADKVLGAGFATGAVVALILGFAPVPGWSVPVLFALMGFGIGVAGPSRDLLVRAAAPPGATGRVYGMVYSGLDVGMACAPALFGWLMDHKQPAYVWLGIAVFQVILIASVLRIGANVRIQQRGPAPGLSKAG